MIYRDGWSEWLHDVEPPDQERTICGLLVDPLTRATTEEANRIAKCEKCFPLTLGNSGEATG